jgi:hypothetical protein
MEECRLWPEAVSDCIPAHRSGSHFAAWTIAEKTAIHGENGYFQPAIASIMLIEWCPKCVDITA